MNPTTCTCGQATAATEHDFDVFDAADWFNGLWNSSAKAISRNLLDWQCNSWGSGSGPRLREEVAVFEIVAAAFDLDTYCNEEGRDEYVVQVPLAIFGKVMTLIDALPDEPSRWPWLAEEVMYGDEGDEPRPEAMIAVAAEALGLEETAIAENWELLHALGVEE